VSERFDFVVIGAGAAGEAAASYARARGATVALVERDLFGGTCAFWGCMPSKTLLHAAEIRACGGDYPWEKASARRDYMIVREGGDYSDDSVHGPRRLVPLDVARVFWIVPSFANDHEIPARCSLPPLVIDGARTDLGRIEQNLRGPAAP